MGFYSLSDKDATKSLRDAPVVEPFEFDKKEGISYPSDLVNDLSTSLLGKSNADMGSIWVTGYTESTNNIDDSSILKNDTSFDKLSGFHSVGKNPETGSYYDNARDCIYVGSPETTNTMIIQQFVLRSVNDNYFTIKNSAGEIVYKSVLEDILFGDQHGRYPLYKSHVDSDYLGAGYVAHRAYAKIPLYNQDTNEPYADGEYTIEFNYQLAYDLSWVSQSYKFVVDSTLPTIKSIETYSKDGEERVRINITENKIASVVIGYSVAEAQYNEETKQYYIDMSKDEIKASMDSLGDTVLGDYRGRIYLEITDSAYGVNKMIIHFNNDSFTEYEIASGTKINVYNDYDYVDGEFKWVSIDYEGLETEIDQPNGTKIENIDICNSTKIKVSTPITDYSIIDFDLVFMA